jgi:hypothetical protein
MAVNLAYPARNMGKLTQKATASWSNSFMRHCEEQSDAAIQFRLRQSLWIAAHASVLAMTK